MLYSLLEIITQELVGTKLLEPEIKNLQGKICKLSAKLKVLRAGIKTGRLRILWSLFVVEFGKHLALNGLK